MQDESIFWDRLVGTTDPQSCWLWPGATTGHKRLAYGHIIRAKRNWKAHRFAYYLTYGPIPPGLHVCHRCDIPLCCNPAHLFLGTPKENSQDAITKGRYALGFSRKDTRLSDSDVRSIRALSAAGGTTRAIAAQFGVDGSHVSRIVTGRKRQHVV